ncbi:MAG: DNA alkylation repair protein [Alteromonadaceae bacterium]|nr:DNA alkylation repair protein [Alteromonadaceae bacterium]
MALVEYLKSEMQRLAMPEKAASMQAYMKTTQPFYGLAAPARKQIIRSAKKQFQIVDFAEYQTTIETLWHGSCREDMYMALEIAEQYRQFRTLEALPLYERLLKTASNWDTVDWISGTLIGLLLLNNELLPSKVVKWQADENFWVRRCALLAHLKHKSDTQTELLASSIILLAPETEFFIRKAIGWVLREYSKTNPDWVNEFVAENKTILSRLSYREALKNINKNK